MLNQNKFLYGEYFKRKPFYMSSICSMQNLRFIPYVSYEYQETIGLQ